MGTRRAGWTQEDVQHAQQPPASFQASLSMSAQAAAEIYCAPCFLENKVNGYRQVDEGITDVNLPHLNAQGRQTAADVGVGFLEMRGLGSGRWEKNGCGGARTGSKLILMLPKGIMLKPYHQHCDVLIEYEEVLEGVGYRDRKKLWE